MGTPHFSLQILGHSQVQTSISRDTGKVPEREVWLVVIEKLLRATVWFGAYNVEGLELRLEGLCFQNVGFRDRGLGFV